jgi:hypothetical protein
MTVSDLLFDTPWWLPTIIIAVGLFAFLSGNKRTIRWLRNAGLAVVGVGLLLIAVSWLVDTDKEVVIKRSRELVKDVEGREWDAAGKLMASDVRFEGAGRTYDGRDGLIAGARVAVESVGLNTATVTKVTPTVMGPTVISEFRVFADANKVGGQQVPTDWQLHWAKSPDRGWVVTEIRMLPTTLSPEAVRQQLPPK